MNLNKLKRDFLAAFPVVGPHNNIEAELMLAGLKPIAFFTVFPDGFDFEGFENILYWKKEHADRIKLDEAVAAGRLISMDVISNDPEKGNKRYYGQIGQEAAIAKLVEGEKAHEKGSLSKEQQELFKAYGMYLGYRRRDRAFFHLKNNFAAAFVGLSDEVNHILNIFNSPSQRALRDKLLEKAGIEDPNTYLDRTYASLSSKTDPSPES